MLSACAGLQSRHAGRRTQVRRRLIKSAPQEDLQAVTDLSKPEDYRWSSALLWRSPEGDYEVFGGGGTYVAPAVVLVGSYINYIAGTDSAGLPFDLHFERSLAQHRHLFVGVLMRGVRHFAGAQAGLVHVDEVAVVRLPPEELARLVGGMLIGVDVGVVINHRGQIVRIGARGGRSHGRQQ